MQKVVCLQSLAFDDGMKSRGEVIELQKSLAKQLKDAGVVEYVGEETEGEPVSKSKDNSVTFSDATGKKVYDTGTTKQHVEEDKKKPSVVEGKKAKDHKEK